MVALPLSRAVTLPSNMFTVPTILKMMVEHPAVDKYDHSSLRFVIYAGAPMYREDQKAALHKLAAEIELATPASERWCVNTEDFNESGRVYLELADAMPAEAARGIAVLRKLVGIISWQALATSAPQQ